MRAVSVHPMKQREGDESRVREFVLRPRVFTWKYVSTHVHMDWSNDASKQSYNTFDFCLVGVDHG